MRPLLIYILLLTLFVACSDDSTAPEATSIIHDKQLVIPNDQSNAQTNWEEVTYSPKEFVDWVKNDEGYFTRKKNIGDLSFKLFYLPQEYMTVNEFKSNNINKVEFDSVKNRYADMIYFMLQIQPEASVELAKYQLPSPQEYDQRIRYYSFEMEKDIQATDENGKQIPTSIYHFERTYSITPYSTFLFGFLKEELTSNNITIEYNERIFNKGKLKFQYNLDNYTNLPKLELL